MEFIKRFKDHATTLVIVAVLQFITYQGLTSDFEDLKTQLEKKADKDNFNEFKTDIKLKLDKIYDIVLDLKK